jgi:hypothetical protein
MRSEAGECDSVCEGIVMDMLFPDLIDHSRSLALSSDRSEISVVVFGI